MGIELCWEGLAVGICTFLTIGLFHPLVIKAEYYTGTRFWWVFLVAGIGVAACSLLVTNLLLSCYLGVFAFCCLWSIGELFQQKKRVQKGWFPMNPKRKDEY